MNKETLKEQNIALQDTDKAKETLASLGYHPAFGARPLRRAIQEHVEDQITDLLLTDEEVNEVFIDVNEQQEIRVTSKLK